eukprot:GHVU01172556.1.p1 GENE.GHVU01172556.1~~GHVU01172556.1.p1  ORF type:complete len:117 (+),score=3.11 GHVU01172556.1:511-861(+)
MKVQGPCSTCGRRCRRGACFKLGPEKISVLHTLVASVRRPPIRAWRQASYPARRVDATWNLGDCLMRYRSYTDNNIAAISGGKCNEIWRLCIGEEELSVTAKDVLAQSALSLRFFS